MDDERSYTEREHVALLTDAVARETATLAAAKNELETERAAQAATLSALETEKANLAARIDVLEAEKAAFEAERDVATKAFEDFKAELAEKDAVAERKVERVGRVKAAARLPDTYFTDDRAQRWAEMSDEQFDVLVGDIEGAAAANPKAPHSFADKSGSGKCDTCGMTEKGGMHTDPEDLKDGGKDENTESGGCGGGKKSRQTAAFTGGIAPGVDAGMSTFSQFLQATGLQPTTNNN